MSIVLDSLRPNDACREQIGPNDRCRVEANFHIVLTEPVDPNPRVTRMEEQDTLRFRREMRGGQLRFVLDQPALNSIFRALTMTHHFNPEGDANLQAAFNFSVVLTPFLRSFFEEFVQRQRLQGPELNETLERFLNYLMVGEIHHPDPLQQEQNFFLYRRALLLSPEAAQGFRDFLIGVLLDGNRSRLSPAMTDRLDRLREVMNFGHRISQALPVLEAQQALRVHIREAQFQIVQYLYRGEGRYDSVIQTLRPLALQLYRESGERHLNLYQIFRTSLEPLRGQAPFQRDTSARNRMQLLLRALELPGLAQDLELSVLEPREALERSVIQGVSVALPSAPSSPVREAVHAVFSALQFTNAASESSSLPVDPAALRNLRFQMDQVLTRHPSQRRDFARLFLGVLDFMSGPSRGFRGFWNGQMRQVTLSYDASSRTYLQSLRSWLETLTGGGSHPERIALPLAEGALCLAGGGLLAWGALAPPPAGAWNLPLISGGGVAGLGCGALGTHFIPSRNRYAADAIGGGVGAVIGVGIPILIHLLGGSAGMPPLDGRNPVTGRGP